MEILYYKDILKSGLDWIYNNNCKGYDPYDGSNTSLSILKHSKYLRLGLVYLNKFSPINLRPLFGIKKRINLQAISYLLKILIDNPHLIVENCSLDYILNYIFSKSLISKYGYHCWNGNDMYIQTKNELQKPEMPGIIGTVLIGNSLLYYYDKVNKKEEIKNAILSIKDFIINVLLTDYEGNVFIKYKPQTKKYIFTYNASILAAQFILKVNYYFKKDTYNIEAKNCYYNVISKQHFNGSWNYSINLLTNREKKQIDFHQGFILDSLLTYIKLFPEDSYVKESYQRGLKFYKNNQFTNEGRGYYRYPKEWPVNIFNQSQAIITFSKASFIDEEYGVFSEKILNWTIKNMLDKNLYYFYFFKYKYYTIKIPYLRWSQSHMLYAINEFLKIREF